MRSRKNSGRTLFLSEWTRVGLWVESLQSEAGWVGSRSRWEDMIAVGVARKCSGGGGGSGSYAIAIVACVTNVSTLDKRIGIGASV